MSCRISALTLPLAIAFFALSLAPAAHAQQAACQDAYDAVLELRILQSSPAARAFSDNNSDPKYAQELVIYNQGAAAMEAQDFAKACEAFRALKNRFGIQGMGELQLSPNTCTAQSVQDRFVNALTTRRALAWQSTPEEPASKQAATVFENSYKTIEAAVAASNLPAACAELLKLESYAGVR